MKTRALFHSTNICQVASSFLDIWETVVNRTKALHSSVCVPDIGIGPRKAIPGRRLVSHTELVSRSSRLAGNRNHPEIAAWAAPSPCYPPPRLLLWRASAGCWRPARTRLNTLQQSQPGAHRDPLFGLSRICPASQIQDTSHRDWVSALLDPSPWAELDVPGTWPSPRPFLAFFPQRVYLLCLAGSRGPGIDLRRARCPGMLCSQQKRKGEMAACVDGNGQ